MARGVARAGAGRMDWAVAFAPRMRLTIVERRGLVLDTRFVPPAVQAAGDNLCLYLLLRGTWRLGGGALGFEGPAAFVVSEEQLEGGDGAHSLTYRTDARDFAMIEVHVGAGDTSLRPGALPTPVPLDERAWGAARRASAGALRDDDSAASAISELVSELAASSIVGADAAASATRPVAAPFRVLWGALRPAVERFNLLASLDQISASMGTPPREVDRHVRAFISASGLVGGGWRPASRHLRLKMAVILLSADGASVAEVARVVGYGSSDAMARAFRDAALPSPGAVRDAVRRSALEDALRGLE